MNHINNPPQKTWYIAHNGQESINYDYIEPSQCFITAQPILETFTDEESWKTRLLELNININNDGTNINE